MPCGARTASHLSGRVRWTYRLALETLPSGETRWACQHRQRLGASATGPPRFSFIAGCWDLLHHSAELVIGDKLETRNRLESAPLIFGEKPPV